MNTDKQRRLETDLSDFFEDDTELLISVLALSAAPVLTDNLALNILETCNFNRDFSEKVISAVKHSTLCVPRNSEWHIRPEIRLALAHSLKDKKEYADIYSKAHLFLLELTKNRKKFDSTSTFPSYLFRGSGHAYHHVAVYGVNKISNYIISFEKEKHDGDRWLMNQLMKEQQKLGILNFDLQESYYISARVFYRDRDFELAKDLFKKVVEHNHRTFESAVSFTFLGIIAEHSQDIKNAIQYYSNAIRVSRKLIKRNQELLKRELSRNLAISLHCLGNIKRTSNRKKSKQLLEESLGILEHIHDEEGIAQVKHSLAILISDEDLDIAEKYLLSALEIDRKYDNLEGISQIYNTLGSLFSKLDFIKARSYLNDGLSIARKLKNKRNLSHLLLTMGSVVGTRDLNAAEQYLKESFDLGKAVGDQKHQAFVLNSLGKIFKKTNINKSKEYFDKSLAIGRSIHDTKHIIFALNSLGSLLIEDDGHLACQYLEEALELSRKTKNKRAIFVSLQTLALYHFKNKLYAKAESMFIEAMKLNSRYNERKETLRYLFEIAYNSNNTPKMTYLSLLIIKDEINKCNEGEAKNNIINLISKLKLSLAFNEISDFHENVYNFFQYHAGRNYIRNIYSLSLLCDSFLIKDTAEKMLSIQDVQN